MASQRLCAFCGERGTSEEDVFARWITPVVPDAFGSGPMTLTRSQGRSKAGLMSLRVTNRAVCRACNNGWMSRVEQAAKPLLTPIFRDESTVLTKASEIVLVSAWAFKTALMYERAHRAPWHTPDEHFSYVYERGAPPPNASVAIGRYRPQPGQVPHIAWAERARVGPMTVDGETFAGYRVTFSIAHAIFQVYGHPSSTDFKLERGGYPDGSDDPVPLFRSIWPLDFGVVDLPQPLALDTETLHRLEHGQDAAGTDI